METNKTSLYRRVVRIKAKGDFMSKFWFFVCLCILGFLASCKSLCRFEEPAVVSVVEAVPETASFSFEPVPDSAPTSCKAEPLPAAPVAPVAPIVESRPEPEAQPAYANCATKESVSEREVAEHYMTAGRLQMVTLVLLLFCVCMVLLIIRERKKFKKLHKSGD